MSGCLVVAELQAVLWVSLVGGLSSFLGQNRRVSVASESFQVFPLVRVQGCLSCGCVAVKSTYANTKLLIIFKFFDFQLIPKVVEWWK